MIDIQEIRRYNEELKEKKALANNLEAQIRVYEQEMAKKCEELTQELNIQVDPDNIDQIYGEYERKIRQAIDTGREVLKKIADDELNIRNGKTGVQTGNQTVQEIADTQNWETQTGTAQMNTMQFGQGVQTGVQQGIQQGVPNVFMQTAQGTGVPFIQQMPQQGGTAGFGTGFANGTFKI